jgi:ComF family protein
MGGSVDLTNALRGVVKPFLDFFFPPTCLACQNLLSDTERHVCSSCWNSIPRLNSAHPIFCQTRDRLVESEAISELISVFLFEKEGAFQALAHALKYDGFKSVGHLMGRELGAAFLQSRMTADCVIPVPLHRVKFRERGFNQAEMIARGFSEVTGIRVRTDILRRRRYTKTQTKLDQEQRKKNVEEAFSVSMTSRILEGETCILVDDVITTGATIVACGEILRKAGFEQIIAASPALAE